MESSRQPTLSEVARAAGVSPATASRVLNGSERIVRGDLRERVFQAAQQLRYVANAHAQALAGGATSTVGLIVHDITDPYFAAISRGVIDVATDRGLLVMVGSTFRSPRREVDFVTTFRAQQARAIVFAGSGFGSPEYQDVMRAELASHHGGGGRYAFISEHNLPGHVVLPDNSGGAADVARALVSLGHRRLAVAGGPPVLTTVRHRIDGFVDAAVAAGVPESQIEIIDQEFSEQGGRAAAREIIARGSEATALFCVSDIMATGALDELTTQGVAVPEDLSLIGFNDIPVMRRLSPPVSSARLDLEAMGRTAMELALDCRGEGADFKVVRFPANIVLRASTAEPRVARRLAVGRAVPARGQATPAGSKQALAGERR